MSYCFVIPNYNHIRGFRELVVSLAQFALPVIIVNDASDEAVRVQLEHIAQELDYVELIHHKVNQGKGGAVQTGLKAAYERQFSHALQIDADGQHDFNDIAKFLAASQSRPEEVISGAPVYDESVPKHRLYGRYITHFWVFIETWSRTLKDTMCGFRVYPLRHYMALAQNVSLGRRMDFDIEVLVRLYWAGVNTHFIPTHVHYPQDGHSHFRGFEDNLRISWLHTRLVFGMLIRVPLLLKNKVTQ